MSIISDNINAGSVAFQAIRREMEEASSPEMEKVRREYVPSDEYIPVPAQPTAHDTSDVRMLDGGWKMSLAPDKPGDNSSTWFDTKVPGQWALQDSSLFNHGGNVWYMKKFTVTPEMMQPGKRLELEFKGVDYKAEVFLNNKKLGEHEGFFAPFKFDVSDKVKTDQENVIKVKVTSDQDPGAPFLKTQIKGIFGQHDARPGGKGASSNIGNTGGIWNDVLLKSTGMQTIENSHVTSELSDDHKEAKLGFHYTIFNHENKEKDVEVAIGFKPQSSDKPEDLKLVSEKVHLKPGFNQVSLSATEQDPHLWWTWDHGKPELYDIQTAIVDGENVAQMESSHFGIRKLDYDPKTMLLKLNDKAVFQRGSNYIPTQWLSTYSNDDYAKDIKLMKDANLNSIRVHAHVLPHQFYDMADKEGILVYGDFPMIWGMKPDKDTQQRAKSQYKEFIENYRNHPSIWMWNVHNESLPYNHFMDNDLFKMGKELDPTRAHKQDSSFLDHFYPGWYKWYGNEFTDITRYHAKLPTEYGSEAIPLSAKQYIPKEAQWPMNDNVWKYHDYQPVEMQKSIGDYKEYKNLDEFIEASQKYQFDLNRHITEYFRRHKYEPSTGAYQFMLKEAWPSVTWAVADHNRNPKMGFQALKESMAPTIVSIDWKKTNFKAGETFKAPLWVINDQYDKISGAKIEWKFCKKDDPERKPIISGSFGKDIEADSSESFCEAQFKIPKDSAPGEKWALFVDLKDKDGNVISSGNLLFGVKDKNNKSHKYEPIHTDYPPVG
ncbi:MAG: beta galactosidase jelly roll domain-containing protein [Firmicutes bacterium]|nr:beta galactosidase jelly roll domain-containing protein [Bacillota bacterium]